MKNELEKMVFKTLNPKLARYNGTVVSVDPQTVDKMYKVEFWDGKTAWAYEDELSEAYYVYSPNQTAEQRCEVDLLNEWAKHYLMCDNNTRHMFQCAENNNMESMSVDELKAKIESMRNHLLSCGVKERDLDG